MSERVTTYDGRLLNESRELKWPRLRRAVKIFSWGEIAVGAVINSGLLLALGIGKLVAEHVSKGSSRSQ